MIEEGLRFLDESDSDSIEDGCLLLGLTNQDVIDLDCKLSSFTRFRTGFRFQDMLKLQLFHHKPFVLGTL